MKIKKLIPKSIKLFLQQLKRNIFDMLNGQMFYFAKARQSSKDFSYYIKRQQNIKKTSTSFAKEQNLLKAIESIEPVEINPQEIFSFWNIVGNPTKEKGFKESRTIINGTLKPSFGGGLCQLSGLIYYISLEANLEIIERHNHSVDIYTDETRYTPLGSDATVVFAYRDLRIRNNLDFPIKYSFSLTDNYLQIRINSTKPISKSVLKFEKKDISKNTIEVITKINKLIINKSKYIKS